MQKKNVYNVAEITTLLGICKQKVYSLIHEGNLPCIKIGRRYVIPKAAFEQWLKKQCN